MSTAAKNKVAGFPGVKGGDIFRIADMEFIKFPSIDGKTPVVMRDIAFSSRFGDNNDLRSSDVLAKVQEKILPEIIAAVGRKTSCPNSWKWLVKTISVNLKQI